jgi:hypothetical protein
MGLRFRQGEIASGHEGLVQIESAQDAAVNLGGVRRAGGGFDD